MVHANMHSNMKRQAPGGSLTSLPTIITGANSQVTIPPDRTSLAIDTGSPLTYITKTFAITSTVGGIATVITDIRTIPITNSAEFSSIVASQTSSDTSSLSTSSQSSTATSSAAAAAKPSGSNNLGTLIPAIVVPIAVVFIGSFVAFWVVMRKRHKKQLKEEPDFVMATKPEKPLSRGNSASSGHSSTRELVPMSKLEKEVVITTTSDVKRSSMDMFPPSYAPQGDIGVARPMTPPDKKNNGDRKSFKNFSSVRPGTTSGNRSRSGSTNHTRDMSGPRAATRNTPASRPVRGPSPAMRNPAAQANNRAASQPRSPPRLHGISPNGSISNSLQPPSFKTTDPPTPTGAFNGASPISQYSPIVKDTPNMAGVALNPKQKQPPAPLHLNNTGATSRGTDSPVDDSVLSRENMRIARLANSSRLGRTDSPVEHGRNDQTDRSLSPLAETHSRSDGSATSPRLPPPLSRDDMSPPNRPFARGPDSPAGGSSIYPSPSIGTGATPRLPQYGMGPSSTSLPMSDAHTTGVASSAQAQRASIVSRLSSDDGYVDMELDGKSDVSSLDERDRWEMESDMRAGSHLGGTYNSQTSRPGNGELSPIETSAPSASSAGTGTSKPNIRDRDSEGPFVLSRY